MSTRHRQTSSTSEMCLYFIAIFIPPLALALRLGQGVSACDVIINVLLWILGWIPGVIHAFWLISKSFKYAPRTVVGAAYPSQPVHGHAHAHGHAQPAYGHPAQPTYGTQPAAYGAQPAYGQKTGRY